MKLENYIKAVLAIEFNELVRIKYSAYLGIDGRRRLIVNKYIYI